MDEKEQSAAWELVVRKLARLMRSMEEQSGFLSKEEAEDESDAHLSRTQSHELNRKSKVRRIYALCEMIMEDLNNYSECMIPIGAWNRSSVEAILLGSSI